MNYYTNRNKYYMRLKYSPSTTAKDPPAATHIDASIKKVEKEEWTIWLFRKR